MIGISAQTLSKYMLRLDHMRHTLKTKNLLKTKEIKIYKSKRAMKTKNVLKESARMKIKTNQYLLFQEPQTSP